MTNLKRILSVGALVALTGACVTPGRRTAQGGVAGAVVGAGVGGATAGTKGAVIGAAAGAAAGAAIGNYLDKQKKELEKEGVPVKKLEDANALLVTLESELLFEVDSAILTEKAIQDLSDVGDILKKYPKDRIRITGHTDAQGSNAYNEALSERRAEAVRKVLRSRGVGDDQMLTVGMGEEQPVAPNSSLAGRAKNRRVELYIDVPQSA